MIFLYTTALQHKFSKKMNKSQQLVLFDVREWLLTKSSMFYDVFSVEWIYANYISLLSENEEQDQNF